MNAAEQGGTANSWETRFGWRVDFEAGGAYLLGPLSGESHTVEAELVRPPGLARSRRGPELNSPRSGRRSLTSPVSSRFIL